jgi:hypothetical protein
MMVREGKIAMYKPEIELDDYEAVLENLYDAASEYEEELTAEQLEAIMGMVPEEWEEWEREED